MANGSKVSSSLAMGCPRLLSRGTRPLARLYPASFHRLDVQFGRAGKAASHTTATHVAPARVASWDDDGGHWVNYGIMDWKWIKVGESIGSETFAQEDFNSEDCAKTDKLVNERCGHKLMQTAPRAFQETRMACFIFPTTDRCPFPRLHIWLCFSLISVPVRI